MFVCLFFSHSKFTAGDAFVGWHGDAVSSIVMQVCSELNREGEDETIEDNWHEKVCYCRFLKESLAKRVFITFHSLWINTEWSPIRSVIEQ